MIWVIKLGSQENLLSGNPRCLDALPDLRFVLICSSGVDMFVSILEREFNSMLDFSWSGFPCTWIVNEINSIAASEGGGHTEANGGHLSSSVEFHRFGNRHDVL